MWIDPDGVMHTAWVPPEAILGEAAVAALRAVPREVAEAAVLELDGSAEAVRQSAAAGVVPGPAVLDEVHPDEIPYPPQLPGLAPREGEPLAQTVLAYLAQVPPQWQVEAMEAVYDVLEPTD